MNNIKNIHISVRQQSNSDKNLYYLQKHLATSIDLFDFIESETSTILKYKDADHAKCHCPFPEHRDTNASFHIKRELDNCCVFNCFGCNKSGTIIHFCMEYFGLRNKLESIKFLCDKFDVKNKEDLILAAIKNTTKRVDIQRKVESLNIITSNQCRMLLRKNFEQNKDWVYESYKTMNKAMTDENCETLEEIGYEASKRMRTK